MQRDFTGIAGLCWIFPGDQRKNILVTPSLFYPICQCKINLADLKVKILRKIPDLGGFRLIWRGNPWWRCESRAICVILC